VVQADVEKFRLWFLTEATRFATIPELVARLAAQLQSVGYDLIRTSLMIRTLHPEIESIRYGWTSDHVEMVPLGRPFFLKKRLTQVDDTTIEEITFSHGAFARSAPYQISPYRQLDLGATEVLAQVKSKDNEYPILDDLRAAGGTSYYLLQLPKIGEYSHRISFATRQTGGFTAAQLELLRQMAVYLAITLEILVGRLITSDLMGVYLGLRPAEKVLAGRVLPGDVDSIESAIWFSDLRGYTDMSEVLAPATLVEWMNEYFETISAPILENGGEILKYMGDAVLAIFPVESQARSQAAAAALTAALSANEKLKSLNATRNKSGLPPMRHGIALHIGNVQYGNIGANRRLDFTVVGPAVNKASRLEGLCKATGRDLLLSSDLAALIEGTELLGKFDLKGISEPESVYVPAVG
jgi:adenylate cyclase